jgi:hypothetical protein
VLGCVGSGQAAKRTLALGALGRYGPQGSYRSAANSRQRARRFAGVPASRVVLQKSMSDVRREEAHRRFRPRCRDARLAGESAASRETRSWAGPRRQNRGISEASEEDDSSMEGGPGQFEAGAPSRESRGSWSRSSRRGASRRESGRGARRGDDGAPRWLDRFGRARKTTPRTGRAIRHRGSCIVICRIRWLASGQPTRHQQPNGTWVLDL